MEPAPAHCPEHCATDRHQRRPDHSGLYHLHRFDQHVAEQHGHHHDDVSHCVVGGEGDGRKQRAKKRVKQLCHVHHDRHCTGVELWWHCHADRHTTQCGLRRFLQQALPHHHRLC